MSGGWMAVPPSLLRGEGLEPYREGEIANLFDWAENPAAASAHAMPYRGRFIVDVVEVEANAVHQPRKPGDEVVAVLAGALELTDDADGGVRRFVAGEAVLIPAGWAGLYRVIPEGGVFRELAIVPSDYFVPGAAAPPDGGTPRRLEAPATAGTHLSHRGRYVVEAEVAGVAATRPHRAAAETVVLVLAGTLVLSDAGGSATFGAGAVVVLPEGLAATTATTRDYRALVLRWPG